jgi:hypothetical protein
MKNNEGLQVSFDDKLKLKTQKQTFKHKYHQEYNFTLDDIQKRNDFFKKEKQE